MNKQKQAFTLVELVVVIMIVAILATIALVSFSKSGSDARDAIRNEDLAKIQTALETYNSKFGEYPIASNSSKINFTGNTIMLAWEQGTFGETTNRITGKIPKIPLDPVTGTEYTYSITNDRQEYQLATIMESESTAFRLPLKQVNAGDGFKAKLKTQGNYNQKVLKIKNVRKSYILAIPSIIHGVEGDVNVKTLLDNKDLLFNGYPNLPKEYKITKYDTKTVELTLVNPNKYIIYEGNLNDLKLYDKQIEFTTKLREAYSGTTIANQEPYIKIVKSVGNEEFIAQSILQKTILPEIEVEAIDQGIN